jgi:serine/threonine protein kinase
MQTENYQYIELIYSRENKVQVWRAFNHAKKLEVVIKILSFDDINEANSIYKEVFSMMKLKYMKSVVKVYDCQLSSIEGKYSISIVMDYYKNGDMKALAQKNNKIDENFLMYHLKSLIDTLAELQEKEIAHRDIKPENIFVDNECNLVIGDVGCATNDFDDEKNSIAGTPLYLSPKVKEAYISFLQGNRIQLNHNLYKSDVYSLGLTMLYLVFKDRLQEIILNQTIPILDQLNSSGLALYQNFSYYIRRMLAHEEEYRPDFIQLSQELTCPETGSKCSKCKIFFDESQRSYYDYGNKYLCTACYDALCQKSPNYNYRHELESRAKTCFKCGFSHTDYPCFSQYTRNYETEYFCINCKGQQICRGLWLNCTTCNITYCIFCRQTIGLGCHEDCVIVLRAQLKTNWGIK